MAMVRPSLSAATLSGVSLVAAKLLRLGATETKRDGRTRARRRSDDRDSLIATFMDAADDYVPLPYPGRWCCSGPPRSRSRPRCPEVVAAISPTRRLNDSRRSSYVHHGSPVRSSPAAGRAARRRRVTSQYIRFREQAFTTA